jgi:aminobenzoyl-glutamate transport protein
MSEPSEALASTKTMTQRILDTVERVGNSVPHPVVIFLILIATVLVLSRLLYMLGATVTYQVIDPDTHKIEAATTTANSLLTADGIRHIYTRLVPNLMGFTAVVHLIVPMMGVGVAEEAGLVNASVSAAGSKPAA